MVRVTDHIVDFGRLARYRLDYGLCHKSVQCLFQRWQANPHNTTLPLYSNEFHMLSVFEL